MDRLKDPTKLVQTDIKANTKIANKTFSDKSVENIQKGLAWLNKNVPGWQTKYQYNK